MKRTVIITLALFALSLGASNSSHFPFGVKASI